VAVQGCVRALLLYDVAEGADLVVLRQLIGDEPSRPPAFHRRVPEYVRFERPPLARDIDAALLPQGAARARVKAYDYGVISIEVELDFEASWEQLVGLAGGVINDAGIPAWCERTAREFLGRYAGAFLKARSNWLHEDYYVVSLFDVRGAGGRRLTGAEILQENGASIAQIVRGEAVVLSASEQREVLRDALSYYPSDLAVLGWTAAVIYDNAESAETALELLSYANIQLLEFRYYDEFLTRVMDDVYRNLDREASLWKRWQFARQARRLNAIRLDVMDLAERADNAVKFLSDMFYARLYRLAASKVGVPDYRKLVDEKLRLTGDLYTFMVDQFNESRAFVLEFLIVFILVIDLFFLFREVW
jgi:hypothetical protein